MSGELAGNAYVEMYVKGKEAFAKAFTQMQASVKMFAANVGRVGGIGFKGITGSLGAAKNLLGSMVGQAGALGAALGLAFSFGNAIRAASDLQETMNKFNVVFGDQAKSMEEWGTAFSKQMGRSKSQVMKFMADMQGFVVPMGVDPGQAQQMSQALTQLSFDLASFNNVSDDEAFSALMSAISGEAEPMKRFGVIVNETAVKAELLKRGLDPTTATESQKAMARYNIILEGTKLAQGDVERSSGSYANRLKALQGAFEDLSAKIGTLFLPYAEALLAWLKDLVEQMGGATSSVDGMSGSMENMSGSMGGVMTIVGGLVKFWNALGFVVNGALYLLRKFFSLMIEVAQFATDNPVTKAIFGTENISNATGALQAAQDELEKGAADSWDAMNKNIDVFGENGVQNWMDGFGESLKKAGDKFKAETAKAQILEGGAPPEPPEGAPVDVGADDPQDINIAKTLTVKNETEPKASATPPQPGAPDKKKVSADLSQITDLGPQNVTEKDLAKVRKAELDAQIEALKEKAQEVANPQAIEANSMAAFERFRENQQNEAKKLAENQIKKLEQIRKALEDPNTMIAAVG